MDCTKELARLEGTRFFSTKPADTPRSVWLHNAAMREAQRWGQGDALANRYARLAAAARLEEKA